MKERCEWASGNSLLIGYHDREWGVPVHDDQRLFEFLVLEGMQAGLSWLTVLKKRENFRLAFEGFDPVTVAAYGEDKVRDLLQNPGVIRNKLKIRSALENAKAFLKVKEQFGGFHQYIWQFVGGTPVLNRWRSISEIPPKSSESEAMSKDLKGS